MANSSKRAKFLSIIAFRFNDDGDRECDIYDINDKNNTMLLKKRRKKLGY